MCNEQRRKINFAELRKKHFYYTFHYVSEPLCDFCTWMLAVDSPGLKILPKCVM